MENKALKDLRSIYTSADNNELLMKRFSSFHRVQSHQRAGDRLQLKPGNVSAEHLCRGNGRAQDLKNAPCAGEREGNKFTRVRLM